MKTITIGRGDGCDILIDDDMISRRHAILKISAFGKMEIVDMGKNGTYVNGVRLRPNTPFPVNRKNIVNFANVHQLDWALIPDPTKYYKWVAMAFAILVALFLFVRIAMVFVAPEVDEDNVELNSGYRESCEEQSSSPITDGKKDTVKTKKQDEEIKVKDIKKLFKKPDTPKEKKEKVKSKEDNKKSDSKSEKEQNMPII